MDTDVQGLLKSLIGHYGWMVVTFGIMFFFKESIMNMIQGMQIFMGNDFNNDDVIYISGREARVVRVGMTKTVFYMTDRGSKMVVPNEKLKSLTLEKRLPRGARQAKDGYLPKSTDSLSVEAQKSLHAVSKEKTVRDKGKKISKK
jgi:hypothetical protein